MRSLFKRALPWVSLATGIAGAALMNRSPGRAWLVVVAAVAGFAVLTVANVVRTKRKHVKWALSWSSQLAMQQALAFPLPFYLKAARVWSQGEINSPEPGHVAFFALYAIAFATVLWDPLFQRAMTSTIAAFSLQAFAAFVGLDMVLPVLGSSNEASLWLSGAATAVGVPLAVALSRVHGGARGPGVAAAPHRADDVDRDAVPSGEANAASAIEMAGAGAADVAGAAGAIEVAEAGVVHVAGAAGAIVLVTSTTTTTTTPTFVQDQTPSSSLSWSMRAATVAGAVFVVVAARFAAPFVPPAPLELISIAIGTGIVDRELTGGSPSLDAPSSLYCHAAIKAPLGLKDALFFVWTKDSVRYDPIALDIRGGRDAGFRTWSKQPPTPGSWRCAVETASGQVLGSARAIVH